MYSLVRRFALSLLCLVALSSAAWAQTLPGSIEGSGGLIFPGQMGNDAKPLTSAPAPPADPGTNVFFGNHTAYVGSMTYDKWGPLAVLAEAGHQSLGSTSIAKYSTIFIGFGARYYFHQYHRLVPYVVAAGGYDHLGGRQIDTINTIGEHGAYAGGGAGLTMYVTEYMGIRPEMRYQANLIGLTSQFNQVQGSISVFFQFGGKKK
jgi:hypothetical protein